MYIKMQNIDALHNKLLELKILVFVLNFLNADISQEDYFLSGFGLKIEEVKFYLTDLIYESLKSLLNLVYADDFYEKIG